MSGRRILHQLAPGVLRWARERAGLEPDCLAARMRVRLERLLEWESTGKISLAQADRLAHQTHTPLGYLFLKQPPDETLPIPEFRTFTGKAPARPSPDLLATIFLMKRRQAWMREELAELGAEPLPFVGSCKNEPRSEAVASAMQEAFSLPSGWTLSQPNWSSALGQLRARADEAGVLTVFNGVVGNSTSRKLDRAEFQGFALVDAHAPLVFVNAADFKTAQMFTLAHELAHLLIGAAGLSRLGGAGLPHDGTERRCNAAAAEFLVPKQGVIDHWNYAAPADEALEAVARRFKVSVLVAARRAVHLNLISPTEFRRFYDRHTGGVKLPRSGGGSFWNNQNFRIGHRFGSAVCRAVLAGRLSYREAYGLTGLWGDTFEKLVARMGGTQ